MNPRERLASLTHELAHLHHGDDLVALLAEVWRALTWFYPPVHLTMSLPAPGAGVSLRRPGGREAGDARALRPMAAGPGPGPGRVRRLRSWPRRSWADEPGGPHPADHPRRAAMGRAARPPAPGDPGPCGVPDAGRGRLGPTGRVRGPGGGRGTGRCPAAGDHPAQLAARIREAMSRYDDKGSFRVVFTDHQDTNWDPEDQKPIMVSFRGRARYESDGGPVARGVRLDDAEPPARPGCSPTVGPPGSTASSITTGRSRRMNSSSASRLLRRHWTPRACIWERTEELVRMLEETGSRQVLDRDRATGRRRHEMLRRREQEARMAEWGSETIISPRQGYLPIRRKWTRERQDLFLRTNCTASTRSPPASGHPTRIEYESIIGPRRRSLSPLDHRRRIQVVEYRPRHDPAGDRVPARDPLRSRCHRPPAGLVVPQ